MNRRIVAGVVMAAAMLPGCFLFGAEETEQTAAPEPQGGGGGGGGEPVPPSDACLEQPGFGALVVTSDRPAPDLPISASALSAVRNSEEDFIAGNVTFELWVRPEASDATACPTVSGALDATDDPAVEMLETCALGLNTDEAQRPGIVWGCLTGDPTRDVCGPLATVLDEEGVPLIELRLFGSCVVGQVRAGGARPFCLQPNAPRYTASAGAWTHVAVAVGESPEGGGGLETISVGLVVNGDSSGGRPVDGGFVIPAGAIRLGRAAGSTGAGITASFDEVRLWAKRRAGTSLFRAMSRAPESDRSGLVSRWGFDGGARLLSEREPIPVLCDDLAPEAPLAVEDGLVEEGGPIGLEAALLGGDTQGACPTANGTLPSWMTPEGVVLCGAREDANLAAPLEGRGAEFCVEPFSPCTVDSPDLRLLVEGRGAEGVPQCWAIAGARMRRRLDAHDPDAVRACLAACDRVGTEPPTELDYAPERLAIGVACTVDRPVAGPSECALAGLPAAFAPVDDNSCNLHGKLAGVACCRD